MIHRADPRFLADLKKYGTVNIESCFNCGNCSAVCPLSTEDDNFPRRMIRYAQIGMREELLSSKELWLCYSCGECTSTCPRQADPGEFMAAARRYAIAAYDRSGVAKLLETSTAFRIVFLTALTAALSVFFYRYHGPMSYDVLRLFDFLPYEVIHWTGIIAGFLVGIIALAAVAVMAKKLGKEGADHDRRGIHRLGALCDTLVVEVLGQRRYRLDCEMYAGGQPWYVQKWFVHASIMWGFLGLLLATALDYLLAILGVKPTGTWVPLWYPVRLLGTLAGGMFVYGTTAAMVRRLRKTDEGSAHSTSTDWIFLVLLWLGGVTGFGVEIALYLPRPYAWSYWVLLIHLVVVAELLLLLPFSKFAHVLYRTLSLSVLAMRRVPESEPAAGEAQEQKLAG